VTPATTVVATIVSDCDASARVRAVLRCGQGGDDGRFGALFGTRAGAAGGTQSTAAEFCSACLRAGIERRACTCYCARTRHL
jgi:hypothetical protein